MAQPRLRVALDANVLIAGILLPRWPHEVMRAGLAGYFDLFLPQQVIDEARRHLPPPSQEVLDFYLSQSDYKALPMPDHRLVAENLDLVRSEKDVPIALSLLLGEVDIFVTNDRDFTDPGATTNDFRNRVRVMLPAVFLRDVLGWLPDGLEAIRNRTWQDTVPPFIDN